MIHDSYVLDDCVLQLRGGGGEEEGKCNSRIKCITKNVTSLQTAVREDELFEELRLSSGTLFCPTRHAETKKRNCARRRMGICFLVQEVY